MQTFHKREDIPSELTWNLEGLFARHEQWEQAFDALEQTLPQLEALKGSLAGSGQALLEVLQQRDALFERLERLRIYASLRADEDTTNSLYQGMADRATQLVGRARSAASFLEPEILALPEHQLAQLVQQTPGLALYKHWLRDVERKRPHVRSAEIEAILAETREITTGPRTIYSMMEDADMKLPIILDEAGEEVALTKGRYRVIVRSPDRRVRKDAFEALHGAYFQQRHTLSATLTAQIKSDLFYTRQRRYPTCRERALADSNIPISVYESLISTVNDYLPVLKHYLRLRKRHLHLDELHMYDLHVPLVEQKEEEISYRQACPSVIQALAPLGQTYLAQLKKGLQQRWIDVYETPGKGNQEYSDSVYGVQPFILLNFQDRRASMYTLAHELGHAMHSWFTYTHQPYVYSHSSLFVAEVAALVNEALLTEYLLQTSTDRATRLAILNQSLEQIRNILFRQTMLAEFEQQIHSRAEEGEPLTTETLISLYLALNEKYYGGETIIDELIGIEWALLIHFYLNFYVYQYATGIAAALALMQQILYEGQPAVDRYLKFLSAGSSDDSIELLKEAGVDMTSPQPVRQALQLFASHLAQMEQLLADQ